MEPMPVFSYLEKERSRKGNSMYVNFTSYIYNDTIIHGYVFH